MKQKFQYSVVVLMLLVIFLIRSSQTSARRLAVKEGEADVKISSKKLSVAKMATLDSLNKLMGLEECEHEDEECLKRRVVEEAHLDYIYTQQRKP